MNSLNKVCGWMQSVFEYLFPPKEIIETWALVDTLQTTDESTVCVVQSYLTGKISVRKRYAIDSSQSRNEIGSLRAVSHPNIITMENVVYEQDSVDIILKYYDTDLFSYIRATSAHDHVFFASMALKGRVDWMRGIAAGLQHLHDNEIIHCDIKPENILIDRKTTLQNSTKGAVLADFGFATHYTRPDKTITGCKGSIQYAAPELFRQEVNKGIPLDIFSFGATLWVVVYGMFPWVTNTKNGERSDCFQDDGYKVDSESSADTKRVITSLIKLTTLRHPDRRLPLQKIAGALKLISERYAADYTMSIRIEE